MSTARIVHDDDEALAPPSEEPAEVSRVLVVGHEVLFAGEDDESARCDVCERAVSEGDDEGHAVPGRGLYVWTRGDDVATKREEPPLCPSCAAALGLTALARWEIEEEEG